MLVFKYSEAIKTRTERSREKIGEAGSNKKQPAKKAAEKNKIGIADVVRRGAKIFPKALSSHLPAKLSRWSFYCVRIARATGGESYCESTEHVDVNTARARLPMDRGRQKKKGQRWSAAGVAGVTASLLVLRKRRAARGHFKNGRKKYIRGKRGYVPGVGRCQHGFLIRAGSAPPPDILHRRDPFIKVSFPFRRVSTGRIATHRAVTRASRERDRERKKKGIKKSVKKMLHGMNLNR